MNTKRWSKAILALEQKEKVNPSDTAEKEFNRDFKAFVESEAWGVAINLLKATGDTITICRVDGGDAEYSGSYDDTYFLDHRGLMRRREHVDVAHNESQEDTVVEPCEVHDIIYAITKLENPNQFLEKIQKELDVIAEKVLSKKK